MNREALRKVAKINGVSVSEVRREMKLAIRAAYENPNEAATAVPGRGKIPTTKEFIDFCAGEVKSARIK